MKLRHLTDDGSLEPGFVLVQHKWRKGRDGKPLVDTISESVYKRLPAFRGEDPTNDSGHTVDIPKQGWELIDPASLQTPKAAVEAEENKAQEEVQAEDDEPESFEFGPIKAEVKKSSAPTRRRNTRKK